MRHNESAGFPNLNRPYHRHMRPHDEHTERPHGEDEAGEQVAEQAARRGALRVVVVVVVVVAVADHGAAVEDANEGNGEPRERRKGRQRCSHQYLWGFRLGPAPGAADDVGRVWNPGGGGGALALIIRTTKMFQKTVTTLSNRRKRIMHVPRYPRLPWPLRRAHLRALLLGVGLAAVRRRPPPRPALRGAFSAAAESSVSRPRQACASFRLVEREPDGRAGEKSKVDRPGAQNSTMFEENPELGRPSWLGLCATTNDERQHRPCAAQSTAAARPALLDTRRTCRAAAQSPGAQRCVSDRTRYAAGGGFQRVERARRPAPGRCRGPCAQGRERDAEVVHGQESHEKSGPRTRAVAAAAAGVCLLLLLLPLPLAAIG
ncbi:hypothetical protein BBO_02132 [Beauveria brongniartii RCEF 3172]|uniref:Uncharacterized protein n=1 Tax=Beauveria brongniartii RCEF 3172 TaxID=1081107 RepID=A0A167IHF0_9HYPO|nr:hypothetical protein BBO_02132 [Beauveria brongniartii RCEF 3172]